MNLKNHTKKLNTRKYSKQVGLVSMLIASSMATSAYAITFSDIANNDGAGITFRRAHSPRDATFDALRSQPVFLGSDIAKTPEKARGAPGIAIFDFDNDGDLDIYVTNGPGVANSLYSNQLIETGQLEYVDVAISMGVAATESDSNSVCYGDIDNDGDQDLYVLGAGEPNRLFENQGTSGFVDITQISDLGAGPRYPAGCSMGDVNGDGLLDVVIGNNSITWEDRLSVFQPFAFNDHNQLFMNNGNNLFVDNSIASGIQNLAGLPPGASGRTWAVSLIDYDMDGDVDIIFGDDQAAVPNSSQGGVDRGYIHLMQNDGTGNFSDVTFSSGTDVSGAWMGLAFADFNSDHNMDIFLSSAGDYTLTLLPLPYTLGSDSSRWFLGQADGVFTDPGVGDLVATPFGWGAIAEDYDNDGDTDIIYHGGIDIGPFVDASNPGVILQNDGSANFSYDHAALANSTNHTLRNVQGVASGDLNNDGFIDMVSVSSFDIPDHFPLLPYQTQWGSVFDATAFFFPAFSPIAPGQFTWNGLRPENGTLSVEINSADNANKWATISLQGTVGLTSKGKVNWDGIGAVVSFTPQGGQSVMLPIVGGASFGSQNSLAVNAGLGKAHQGTVEVLWPGGVRNKLYNVRHQERLMLPEIPCSYEQDWSNFQQYHSCVQQSLNELRTNHAIDLHFSLRLYSSALRAFFTHNLGSSF